jgi:hypothetical protein
MFCDKAVEFSDKAADFIQLLAGFFFHLEVALPKFSRPKYQYRNSLASDRSTRAAVRRSHSRLDWVLF